MKILFIDFETYYSDEFTLKKLTPPEYVADPRFEVLNCCFIHEGKEPLVLEQPQIPAYLASIDWTETFVIAHNSLFDMMILSLHYGITAAKYGDTMSMARNWLVHSTGKISLGAIAQYYGMPVKWSTLNKTKGITYAMLCQMPELRREVNEYAADDTIKCRQIFWNMMRGGFPEGELDVIDMVIRMAAHPKFEIDMGRASLHLSNVIAKKEKLLAACGLDDRKALMSDDTLAAMLMLRGVDVPKKVSKTTKKEVYAFAKTDKAFTELLDHDDEEVQAIVAARLGHKSTLEETRTSRFIAIGKVMPRFPIPLKYSGAHTHRFSGDWLINAQNLSRGGELRYSLKAPKGHKVVSVDASQIEARLNACLSGQLDLVEQFRKGEDVYSSFAEKIYRYPVNKKDQPLERFVGKTGILSLGYGSGWPVFMNMCRVQGNVHLIPADASQAVQIYRDTYSKIVANWKFASDFVLPVLAGRLDVGKMMWGPVEVRKGMIILPNGNRLQYRDMVYQHDEERNKFVWIFKRGSRPIYTYGAKIVENVVQALAFVTIMDCAKRVRKETNGLLPMQHQVHDELIFLPEAHLAEQVGKYVAHVMATPPDWMPDAPLAAEYGIGDSYGDAK